MAVISTLDILLRAKNGPLDKDLNDAASKVDRFSQKIDQSGKKQESAMSSLFAGLTGISSKMGLALAGIGAGIAGASWGVKLAAEAETAQMGFEIMLGSAEKARILLSQIQKFGAETPFESSELIVAARSLMSFGVDAGDVMKRLKELGDVASGSQSKIEDLAQIFGKAFVKNKVELEQLNQAAERGIPLYKVLADQIAGGDTKKMAKMVSDGKVTADQLQKAFATMSGSGGIFQDAMKKQSGTMAGMWSTMVDSATMVGKEIGETLTEAFGLKGAIGGLTAASDWILNTIKLWRPVFTETATTIGMFVGQVWDGFKQLGSGIMSVMQPVTDWIAQYLPSSFASMRDNVLSVIFYVQANIANFAAEAQASFYEFEASFEGMWQSIKHIDKSIGRAFINLGIVIWESISSIATNVKNVFTEIWDFIASGGKNKIEFAFEPLSEAGRKAMSDLAKTFDRPLTDIEKQLNAKAKEARESVTANIGQYVEDKMKSVKDKEKEVSGELSGKSKINTNTPDTSSKDKGKNQAEGVSFGSKKAFEVIFGNINGMNDPKVTLAKQQLKATQDTNTKLDQLRGAVAGGAMVAASF